MLTKEAIMNRAKFMPDVAYSWDKAVDALPMVIVDKSITDETEISFNPIINRILFDIVISTHNGFLKIESADGNNAIEKPFNINFGEVERVRDMYLRLYADLEAFDSGKCEYDQERIMSIESTIAYLEETYIGGLM